MKFYRINNFYLNGKKSYLDSSLIALHEDVAYSLGDIEFEELYSLAASLNLDVLAEIHDIHELDFVKSLGIKLLGINNRNLKTFEVDINTSVHLSSCIADE